MRRGSATGTRKGRGGRRLRTSLLAWLAATALLPLTGATRGVPVRTQPANPEWELRVAAAAAIRHNLHLRQLVVYPSPAYYNPYLRDSFWTAQAMGNRRFSVYVLDTFAAAERPDGEPPTWFVNAYRYPRYHDDESAALLLIWAWRNHTLYGDSPPRALLLGALSYLLRHSRGGYAIAPPGRYASWWDAYTWTAPATLSYNQGLYAVAMRCAKRLGLPLPRHAVANGEAAYRALYTPRLGYLPLSEALPAADASALTGEFLSLWLFKRAILPTAAVLSTLNHLAPFGAGFRVVATPGSTSRDGIGFPTDPSVGIPGDYQNGASWLLYDALSIGAAGLHGWSGALPRLRARLALEFRHGVVLHEYLRTNPTLPYYGAEPPWRDLFSWDAFVMIVDNVLHERM